MNIYLTIMVTVLVATQIIRIVQNGIQLYIQEKKIKDAVGWLEENDISERDFNCQREVFYLLREKLKREAADD